MFSLIIAIVSVVLGVILTAAFAYHGGDVLTSGRAQAQLAQAATAISQMQMAVQAYSMDNGQAPAQVSELTPKYLASLPEFFSVQTTGNLTSIAQSALQGADPTEQAALCSALNTRLGITTTPSCANLPADFAGCCTDVGAGAGGDRYPLTVIPMWLHISEFANKYCTNTADHIWPSSGVYASVSSTTPVSGGQMVTVQCSEEASPYVADMPSWFAASDAKFYGCDSGYALSADQTYCVKSNTISMN